MASIFGNISPMASTPVKHHRLGQVYHLVDRGCITWADSHRTAMHVRGRQVQLIGVPRADLQTLEVPHAAICGEVCAYHGHDSAENLCRDVPAFRPVVSLERGMQQVIEAMDRAGRIPNADLEEWEDRMIAAQRQSGRALRHADTDQSR